MRLRVLVMSIRDRAVLGRFIVEAPSIAALMESGEIRRRVGDRHYDSVAIFRDEQAELTPEGCLEVLDVKPG